MDLRDGPEDPAAVDHHAGVEQPRLVPQRRADDDHREQVGTGPHDLVQALVYGIEHRVLSEQVVDGVPGERKLREEDDGYAGFGRTPADLDHAFGVAEGVGDVDVGCARGDSRETVRVQRCEAHPVILSKRLRDAHDWESPRSGIVPVGANRLCHHA